jgi:hypothetical protein
MAVQTEARFYETDVNDPIRGFCAPQAVKFVLWPTDLIISQHVDQTPG